MDDDAIVILARPSKTAAAARWSSSPGRTRTTPGAHVRIIARITAETRLAITLSIGQRSFEDYRPSGGRRGPVPAPARDRQPRALCRALSRKVPNTGSSA
jgi:hypothetical protein